MSRHDDAGADLPPEALTIDQVVDDVVAVLDDAQVDKAVLYGTSYGTYIAAGVGVRHPDRVQAMILDSPLLSQHDIDAVRQAIRGVLWDGATPETAQLAPKVRRLVDDGLLTPAAGRGRRLLWDALGAVALLIFGRKTPYRNEVDLVGPMAFRELNYGPIPDGKPLDPAVAFREFTLKTPDFEAEPHDLVSEMPKFSWPTVVVSGGRDLTTPPAIAERIASLIPDAVLVRLPTAGHSAIDSRERAALDIAKAVCGGHTRELPARAAALDGLPRRPAIRLLVSAITVAAAVEAMLPPTVPRLVQRVSASRRGFASTS
jgi:pimeloyl-ACP methyl ester carboxylesterase